MRARIAAIGPATAELLRSAHLKIDVIGEEFVAESLAAALNEEAVRGRRVLLVRAAVARSFLPDNLRSKGADVEVVEAYRTVADPALAANLERLRKTPPEWITFTSSSTVDQFASAAGGDWWKTIRAASIGPVTSATLRNHGVEPAAEASEYTTEGIVEAIRATSIIGG